MNDVIAQQGPKLAGLHALFFLPVAALLDLPDLDEAGISLLGDLVLATGASWAQLQASTYSPALDVAAGVTVHGPSYEQELAGLYAGDDPAAAAQFQRMQGRRFVLLYRDHQNLVRLVGGAVAGLLFTHKLATGQKPGDRKAYAWSFKGITPGPALFYSGKMPAELEPPEEPSGSGGSVQLRTKDGLLLATVPAGKTIYLDSAFAFIYTIH